MSELREVTILGRTFKVKRMSEAEIKKAVGREYTPEAALHYHKRTILIKKGMTSHEERLALYHEVCHAIMRTTGISQVINPDVQEIICESMASGFCDLVKTN